MFKNLNCRGLGVSGRQSEIIELALTYRFGGIDLDMDEFCKLSNLRGIEHASRFIQSANIKIGVFELPIRWQGDDAIYRTDLAKLPQIAEAAAAIGAAACRTVVMPTCADRPYHENFEFHRHRLTEIAEILAPQGVRLGLDFLAPAYHREDSQFHFISSAEPLILLAKTIGASNVGVMVDAWNWYVGGNAMELVEELSVEQIVGVRLADALPEADRETVREEDRLLPGRGGAIDCVVVLRHLKKVDYAGAVTPYPHAAQFSGMTRDSIVKETGDVLDGIWKAADSGSELKAPAATGAE